MAVRIRTSGEIVCAAMPEQPGDRYVDDNLHYLLSAEHGVLVSEPHESHSLDGLWWWWDEVPEGRQPASYYAERRLHV